MTADRSPRTLAIDVGGTGLKMIVLDPNGAAIEERHRVPTPRPATPRAVLEALRGLIGTQPPFDRVSVGFPGVVHEGVVATAPNLDGDWHGFKLANALSTLTGKPVRVANDADVQGYADIEGRGVEMVLTLGTGLGSALFVDGHLVPNLELAHHPYDGKRTYEDYVGKRALEKVGKKRWRRRVGKMIEHVEPIWNYRLLHLGGGNAKLLHAEGLPANVLVHSNEAGVLGGIALWKD
ncbi:MAG: ROK family protein [Deltaproteobacteria bacterium]|nr:ROK family protein [Deltaproteobacteria bacterium]